MYIIGNFQNADRLKKSMRIRKRSWYREKQEKRLNRMIILMILAFNISWTPYAFVCTLKLVHHNFVSDAWAVPGLLLAKRYNLSLTEEVGEFNAYVSLKYFINYICIFLSSSCCWNPIIYVLLNKQVCIAEFIEFILKFFV